MPDARLQRTRETLPEGYQFGDARDGRPVVLLEPDEFVPFGGFTADAAPVHQKKYPCPLCVGGPLGR
jgi:hypothetical protein